MTSIGPNRANTEGERDMASQATPIRRIITGHDSANKAKVIIEIEEKKLFEVDGVEPAEKISLSRLEGRLRILKGFEKIHRERHVALQTAESLRKGMAIELEKVREQILVSTTSGDSSVCSVILMSNMVLLCMYACTYVCTVCMYCVYVCMYVCMCMCININHHICI